MFPGNYPGRSKFLVVSLSRCGIKKEGIDENYKTDVKNIFKH